METRAKGKRTVSTHTQKNMSGKPVCGEKNCDLKNFEFTFPFCAIYFWMCLHFWFTFIIFRSLTAILKMFAFVFRFCALLFYTCFKFFDLGLLFFDPWLQYFWREYDPIVLALWSARLKVLLFTWSVKSDSCYNVLWLCSAQEQQTMHLHKCDHVKKNCTGGGGGGVVRLTA